MPSPIFNVGTAPNDGTGDPLRIAFQKSNRLPNPDSTINAGSGDYLGTTEAKITAAIADAVVQGKKYVFIPTSMLPYNASAVTFNNAARMLREGALSGNDGYDVRAYGAAGDGITDDTVAMQRAINACIATGGGLVIAPPGTYKITATLDFSAMGGTNKGLTFQGAGSGNQFQTSPVATKGATLILNASGAAAIKAYGSLVTGVSAAPIVSFNLQGFSVLNTANIGSTTYTIDADYLVNGGYWNDIYVDGGSFTGNGIRVTNTANGGHTASFIVCRKFPTGTGHRDACEQTNADGSGRNVDVAPNSGNTVKICCASYDTLVHFSVGGGTNPNLFNSLSFISPKAVNTTDIVGSIGFDLGSNLKCTNFISPHSERNSTGFNFTNARGISLYNPMTTYPAGTPDANSAGLRFGTGAFGNTANGLRSIGLHFAASFESNTGNGNTVSQTESTALTAIYGGAFVAANDTSTLTQNGRTGFSLVSKRREAMWSGLKIITETIDKEGGANAYTTTSQSVQGMAVGLCAGETVTGIALELLNTPTSLTLAKVAVYDTAGNRLGVSADDSANWTGATHRDINLTTPLIITKDGCYYLAVLAIFSGTAPQLLRGVVPGASAANVTNGGARVMVGIGGQSDMPGGPFSWSAGQGGVWLAAY